MGPIADRTRPEKTTADSQSLLERLDRGVLCLTLNRPEANNSFTVPMMRGLHAAFARALKDPEVKAVLLAGAGPAFCAGQDLHEHLERRPAFLDELRERYNPLILKIRRLPKPVIAAVNGAAAGAGMSLALACDFRLCAPEARFYTSFAKIGLVPDSGNLFWLGVQIGFARALELEMTGRPVTAEEAERWGLASRVVPAGSLAQEAEAFARKLAGGPTVALGLVKRMLERALFARSLEGLLEEEALLQEVAGRSRDHAEGLRAFLDKRTPRFEGR